ncbi:MAG: endopeptidase [Gaiellaceae bacterium]|nr:endopeptidase [Gaiellaceae bacterium]
MWALAGAVLWRTKVPADLQLPRLDPEVVFGADAVRAGVRYERFLDYEWLLGTMVNLVALVVMVRRGPRLAASLGLGRINAGVITGVVVMTALWAVSLPFDLATAWWARRHGLSTEDWGTIILTPWGGLLGATFATVVVLAIVLFLAQRFVRNWWVAAAAILLVLGIALQFALPYVNRYGTHPIRRPNLAAAVKQLEARERAGHPAVRVETVSDRTTAANAYAIGIGPSSSVFIWDTMLDGRFTTKEVRFVIGHELAHLGRLHLWKGIAWGALIGVPLLAAVALVTGKRGGLRDPGNVPLALLVLTVLQLALTPFTNLVSRRYEAEADWVGLQGTQDPEAAKGLFKGFVRADLADPSPPGWVHVFLDDHPPLLTRVEQADAFEWRP